ncbi:cytochrome P450 2C8-like isoform X2 [Dendrobates tinctorius]|uniref:cytochrome P450 2C8-like isoform X2 n=1 Tax=Dendrobates tinctorius TaxID=92724 RepID=UPI003CCA4321
MELGVSGTLLLVVLISLILYFFTWRRNLRQKNMPPGPPPLPLLGSLLDLNTKEIPMSLMKLSETYGPVFTVYLSSTPAVVLIGYDCVKEALIDNGDVFSMRGHLEFTQLITNGYGILISNGERCKQLRRFSLSTLRNFGMGKRSIEERIQEEVRYIVEEIEKSGGTQFDPTDLLTLFVSNIICFIVFGERFDYEDVKFMTILNLLKEMFVIMSSNWGMLLNVFPKIISLLPGPHQKIFTNLEKLKYFVAESLEDHKATLDPNCPQDLIDCFLIKMEEEKNNPKTEFHFDNLFGTVIDLFFAGIETLSRTLQYGLLYLLKYPDVESKIHEEMDRVIGQNQCPSVEDRVQMPYTDAVIHEIQRFAAIAPLGLPHATSQDTTFRGYHIPKGTTVVTTLTSVLRDPKYFKNPEQFDPTNFLNDDGSFRKNEAFVPFSLGKRSCIGEGLAQVEIFLFFTTILQKFNLKSVIDKEDIEITPEPNKNGVIPRTYKILQTTMELGVSGTLLLVVLISLILYFFTWRRNIKNKNLPPGPQPLPLLGTMLHVSTKEMPQSLMKLSETYGPVFTIYLAHLPAVVLVGHDCVKEALVENGNMFSGRGHFEMSNLLTNDCGVAFTNGERWKQLRRFSLTTLRNFGMGKTSIEERLQEEARYLTEEIEKTGGTSFDPTHMLTLAVSNVICSIVFGERFDYEDVKFKTLLSLLKEMVLLMSSTWGMLLSLFPKIFSIVPGPHQKIFTHIEKLRVFVFESLKSHKATFDPNCPRDFIDYFLIKMEEEKKNPKTEFHSDNLFGTVMDLFFAGTDTTSTILRYGLLYLLKYPEVEGKRSCIGESLARMEIFLFLTTILQRFNLKSEVDPEDIEITPEPNKNGMLPRTYQMYVTPR